MSLPLVIVREVEMFLSTASKANEVIAAYEDRLVIVRARLKAPIPADVRGANGADVLLGLHKYGRALNLPWPSIDGVESRTQFVPLRQTTFRIRGLGMRRRFSLPWPQSDS